MRPERRPVELVHARLSRAGEAFFHGRASVIDGSTTVHFAVKAKLMNASEIRRALTRMAHEIVESNKGVDDLVIVGIRTRGAPLADRMAGMISSFEGKDVPFGALDVTLYRDDVAFKRPRNLEATTVPADLDGKVVVLVDDVLYTGRTIRAAFDGVLDLGRPRAIRLATLVDRGHREFPIRADHVGKNLPTSTDEVVRVLVEEIDGEDAVLIGSKEPAAGARGSERRSDG